MTPDRSRSYTVDPAVRAHPDYEIGYETAFCQEPPALGASPEYRAGYEAGQRFVLAR